MNKASRLVDRCAYKVCIILLLSTSIKTSLNKTNASAKDCLQKFFIH